MAGSGVQYADVLKMMVGAGWDKKRRKKEKDLAGHGVFAMAGALAKKSTRKVEGWQFWRL